MIPLSILTYFAAPFRFFFQKMIISACMGGVWHVIDDRSTVRCCWLVCVESQMNDWLHFSCFVSSFLMRAPKKLTYVSGPLAALQTRG